MKELFIDIKRILNECMTLFNRNAMTGRPSFSILDCLCYFMLPLLIIIATFYADFTIGKTLNSSIIGVLSIFVVLAFQVIFIASDKYSKRVSDKAREDSKIFEDEKNYLMRMRNYTIQFVRQLVLLLFLSLFIILCSSLGLCLKNHIVQLIISALMLSSFYIWLLILLKMIVSIYKLQMDDIEQNYIRIK
jgi:hypothetical protein